jgi:hypothetical protein
LIAISCDFGADLAIPKAEEIMAKNAQNSGGPTHNPKDEPTADRDNRNAQNNRELAARTHRGAKKGSDGERNGSDKLR